MAEEKKEKAGKEAGDEKKPAFFIDKYKINDLPVGAFRGKISVILPHSPREKIEHAARTLERCRYLGFDTETKPAYRKGESYPIAIIQLSTERRAFLFRVIDGRLPEEVKRILGNPHIIKIGQALKHELRTIKKELKVEGRGFIDMLDIAHKLDCVPKSVRGLSAIFLGFRIVKSAQRTNWARKELTEKQKLYAATDAWACLMVYNEMKRRGLIKYSWKMSHK